jgi:hypothetical protein
MSPSSDRKGETENVLWWALEKETVCITGHWTISRPECTRSVRQKTPARERTENRSSLLGKLKILKYAKESENVDMNEYSRKN